MIKGIDVSSWQGVIDWKKVSEDGIKFAILRAGGSDGSFFTDPKYYRNYLEAKKYGVHVGAYYIVGKYCNSANAGLADAQRFAEIIKDTQLDYPVYIDFELPTSATRYGNTEAVFTFCRYMENLGYYAGIYASDLAGFRDRLDKEKLKPFDKWVAKWGSEPTYAVPYGMWQHTSKGNVKGIAGHVDMNLSKNDYAEIIKQHHLNGF